MDALYSRQKLPTDILQQVYGHVEDVGDRKAWQLVCRRWYNAANYGARIKVRVREDAGFSFINLAHDLTKYPTFGPKILCIIDQVSQEGDSDHHLDTLHSVRVLSNTCLFLKELYLTSWSLKMLNKYLEICKEYGETNLMQLGNIGISNLSSSFSNDTNVIHLQVCHAFCETMTKLNIFLWHTSESLDVFLDKYGGLVQYISQFTNLKIENPNSG